MVRLVLLEGDPLILTIGETRSTGNTCGASPAGEFLGSCHNCLDWNCPAGYWCNGGDTCVVKDGVNTGDLPYNSSVKDTAWIDDWAAVTNCGSNHFQPYKSSEDAASCNIPQKATVCLQIPRVGGTVNRTDSKSQGPRSNPVVQYGNPMLHSKAVIDCNGTTETWHLIDHVNWWEAQELCAKLGLHMVDSVSDFQTSTACGTPRWQLIKNAVGEELGWNASKCSGGNTKNTGCAYAWTNDIPTSDNSCKVYFLWLHNGRVTSNRRDFTGFTRYALCGPKI